MGANINDLPRADTVAADPLEGEQVEIGFKYQPDGAPFLINAAIYELKERNQVISIDTLASSVQGAEVKVRGFEIEAVGKVSRELTTIASYSYTQATYEKYPDLLPGIGFPRCHGRRAGGSSPRAPRLVVGNLHTHNGYFRGVSVGAGVRYVGDSVSNGLNVDLVTNTRSASRHPPTRSSTRWSPTRHPSTAGSSPPRTSRTNILSPRAARCAATALSARRERSQRASSTSSEGKPGTAAHGTACPGLADPGGAPFRLRGGAGR